MNYRKNNITLQIRVPVEQAILIIGRLYGGGFITREQYLSKIKTLDREKAERERRKNKVFMNMIEKSRKFYKKNSCKE